MATERKTITKKELCKRLLTCRITCIGSCTDFVHCIEDVKIEADLSEMDMKRVWFSNVDFTGSSFKNTDLFGATFKNCVLDKVNFDYTQLASAKFINCSMNHTDFWCVNMQSAEMNGCFADNPDRHRQETRFYQCDMRGSRLRYNHIKGVRFEHSTIMDALFDRNDFAEANRLPPMVCPSEGAFIAYKKVRNVNQRKVKDYNIIAKLRIPAKAKRSSATTRKCRASEAKVLGFYKLDGTPIPSTAIKYARSEYDSSFKYTIGETVVPKKPFNEDRWSECASGIHFLMSFEEAVDYPR